MDHEGSMHFTDLPEDVTKYFLAFFGEAKPPAAADRYVALEIGLRRRCLELLANGALSALIEYWRKCLLAVHRAVERLEHQDAATKPAVKKNDNEDTEMVTKPNDLWDELVTMKHAVRKLPILLMEDILDTLDTVQAVTFWSEVAVPSNELLFGDLLWRNVKDPQNKKPCWLVFLKVSNKFLRRLQAEEKFVEAAQVSRLLSMIYPLSEKSTMRGFGSHNIDHLTVFETEEEFDQLEKANAQEVAPSSTTTGYSFYTTFWKLQHDFRNPNSIVVVDFIRRLTMVLRSFQSNMIPGSQSSTYTNTKLSQSQVIFRPYLTQSRILPIQLSDPAMRTLVLTQFWIVSQHLMPKVPALRVQLEPHVRTAETMLPPDHLNLLKESGLFLQSEPQWKQWKQDKCMPDLDEVRKPVAKPKTKRKLPEAIIANHGIESEPSLENVSKKMRAIAPVTKDYMEEFVDAVDPEAGIEEEYHPKNNSVYSWRALRLLSREYLDDFSLIQSNGDFENMIRYVYQTKHGVTIPGEPMPDIPFEDDGIKTNDEIEVAPASQKETTASFDEPENINDKSADAKDLQTDSDNLVVVPSVVPTIDDRMDVEAQPATDLHNGSGSDGLPSSGKTAHEKVPDADRAIGSGDTAKQTNISTLRRTQIAKKEMNGNGVKQEEQEDPQPKDQEQPKDLHQKAEEVKSEPTIPSVANEELEKLDDNINTVGGCIETNGKSVVEPKQAAKAEEKSQNTTKLSQPPEDTNRSKEKVLSFATSVTTSDGPRGMKRPIHETSTPNNVADGRRPHQRPHEETAGERHERRSGRLNFQPPPERRQEAPADRRPAERSRGGDSRGRAGDHNAFRDNRPRHDSRGRRAPNDRRLDDRPDDRRDNRGGGGGRDERQRPHRGGWNNR